jgi:hypothetical protein
MTLARPGWLVTLALLVSACGTVSPQMRPSTLHKSFTLAPGALHQDGLAFLTPATVTGQEQDKQALALIFSETLQTRRPGLRVVTLPEALGLINRAGFANDYRQMIEQHRDTGIFRVDDLRRLGNALGVRYVAQLKLASFGRDLRERFSLLGLRLYQTQYAHIRLYLQIWDTRDGVIAWEGAEEINYAYDSTAERPMTFRIMVEAAATEILRPLP